MKRNTQLSGHGLRHEGRYWNGLAFVAAGMAPARCTCGAESEDLPTGAARKRWHALHKADERRHQEES